MKFKFYLTFIYLFFAVVSLHAQFIPPNPSIPSQNTIGSLNEISNNLYIGKASFNIPIYKLDNYGAIGLQASLSYTGSSGIKTDELPTWVGTGWNLNAGGFVHRVVRGKADESRELTKKYVDYVNSTFNSQAIYDYREFKVKDTKYSYFYNKQLLNTDNWLSNVPGLAASLYQQPNNESVQHITAAPERYETFYNNFPSYDLVPDEFTFSFGTISGRFYMDHTGNWIVVSDNNDYFDINVISSELVINDFIDGNGKRAIVKVPNAIRCIELISKDGIKYTFGSRNAQTKFSDQLIEYSHSSVPHSENYYFPRYRTQFVNGIDDIEVTPHTWHIERVEDLKTGQFVSFSYDVNFQYYKTMQPWGYGGSSSQNGGRIVNSANAVYTSIDCETNIIKEYRLSSLDKVLTRYLTLKSIICSNGVEIKFNTSNATQLTSNEMINESEMSHYNEYDDMWMYPEPMKLISQTSFNIFKKLNSIEIFFNGVLKRKINFDYQLSASQRLQLNKVYEGQLTGTAINKYEFSYNNTVVLPPYGKTLHDHWGYFNNKDFFSVYTGVCTYDQIMEYASYREPDPNKAKAEILEKITYPTGGYVEIEYESNQYSKYRKRDDFSIISLPSNRNGSGVRLKTLKYYAASEELSKTVRYDYSSPLTGLSSGILSFEPQSYVFGNSSFYDFRAAGWDPLMNSEGLVKYTDVKVYETGNGFESFTFSNFDNGFNDRLADIKNINYGLAFNTGYANMDFKRGKILSHKTYREGETDPLQETNYKYEHDNLETNKPELRSLYLSEWGLQYQAVSERIYSNPVTEIVTKNLVNGNENIVKSTYEYDAYNNLKTEVIYINKRERKRKVYKYNYEYASVGNDQISLGLNYLNERGYKSFLVEEVIFLEDNNGSNSKVISGVLNTYKTDRAKVDKVFRLNVLHPISSQSFSISSIDQATTSFVMNANYGEPEIQYTLYDEYGNILEMKNKTNEYTSFIWDYKGNYKVAEIVNSRYNQVGYASFEADGNGGLTYNNQVNIDALAPSGIKKCVLSTSSVIKKVGLPAGTYIVSYLGKDGTVNVNNVPAIKTRAFRDWNYFEHNVTVPTNGEIVISGSGVIDELRIIPLGARMKTYTVDPMAGITTEADANYKMIYHRYDQFNRLILTSDLDLNIINKYCYTPYGQTENCDFQSFSSSAFYGYLTPQNCAQGLIPNPKYIILNEGQFSSTISQEHANILAQQYAQQLANQQGFCISPLYARVEYVPNWVDSYQDSQSETLNNYVDVWVKFYQDENCTQPYTLTQNIEVGFTQYDFFWTTTDYSSTVDGTSVVALAGTNGVLLEPELPLCGYWYAFDENGENIYFERWGTQYKLNPDNPNFSIKPSIYNSITLPIWYW